MMGRNSISASTSRSRSQPGRELEELDPPRAEAEDGPLGDVAHGLPAGRRARAAEGHVLHLLPELHHPPVADDVEAPVLHARVPRLPEQAAEDDPLGVLGDVDEPAAPREAGAELADVDVPGKVDLGERQECQVQPPALVEVELGDLVDDRLHVRLGGQRATAHRQPADRPLLDRDREVVEQPLLGGDDRDAIRDPEADVEHGARTERHRGAAGDQHALVQCDRRGLTPRRAQLPGDRRVVTLDAVDLPGLGVHHDRVDQDPGHAHELRAQAPAPGHALDLRDHQAPVGPGGLRQGQGLEDRRLVLHAHVPELVGRRAADDRHVDGHHREREPVAPVHPHPLDHGRGRHAVQAAPALPRIHEGVETHVGQDPRLPARGGPHHLADDALREAVGLDLVREREGGHPRRVAEPRGDDAPDQPLVGEVARPGVPVVAEPARLEQGQAARMPGRQELPLDRRRHRLGQEEPSGPFHPDRGSVADQLRRRLGGDDLGTRDRALAHGLCPVTPRRRS